MKQEWEADRSEAKEKEPREFSKNKQAQRRIGRNPSPAWGPSSQGPRTTLQRVTADKQLYLHS